MVPDFSHIFSHILPLPAPGEDAEDYLVQEINLTEPFVHSYMFSRLDYETRTIIGINLQDYKRQLEEIREIKAQPRLSPAEFARELTDSFVRMRQTPEILQ